MHYNENANRRQATISEDVDRWSVVYPKAHKGEKAVVKPLKESPTYSKHNNKLAHMIKKALKTMETVNIRLFLVL